jgi:hypothetical protein
MTADEIRQSARNAHPVDARRLLEAADELDRVNALAEAYRDAASRMHDEMEKQAARANQNADLLAEANAENARLRATLESIADMGGEIEREQAREALEQAQPLPTPPGKTHEPEPS